MPRHSLKAEILALAPVLLVTANTEFEREWGRVEGLVQGYV